MSNRETGRDRNFEADLPRHAVSLVIVAAAVHQDGVHGPMVRVDVPRQHHTLRVIIV